MSTARESKLNLLPLAAIVGAVVIGAGFILSCQDSTVQAPPPPSPATPPAASATRPSENAAGAVSDPAAPPNVMIFLIDTLRADRLGTYGYTRRNTSPHIDALAKESVVFEQACAPAPWTLPSVVSLLTSKHVCEHQVVHDRLKLGKSLIPLATRMKRLGYTTMALVGNAYVGEKFGLHRGYKFLQMQIRNDGEKIGAVLDRLPRRPFFFYVHNLEPHNPWFYAPLHLDGFRDVPLETREQIKREYGAWRRLGRADFKRKQPLGTTDNEIEQRGHLDELNALKADYDELYDASVSVADSYVGSTIDMLKQRGLWDDTLFILISDHGEEMNEHGGWVHDQSAYDELMRVPMIVHFPRGEFAGRTISAPVSLVDIVPTIMAVLGKPGAAEDARGRDLMPLVRGDAEPSPDDLLVTGMRINRKMYYRPWAESRGDVNIIVRQGNWKGIWNADPGALELYDLAADPGELNDLSASRGHIAEAMINYARAWYEECAGKAIETRDADELDAETLENLRSLGYVD